MAKPEDRSGMCEEGRKRRRWGPKEKNSSATSCMRVRLELTPGQFLVAGAQSAAAEAPSAPFLLVEPIALYIQA